VDAHLPETDNRGAVYAAVAVRGRVSMPTLARRHRPGPWHARFSDRGFSHEIYDYAGGNVATVNQWSDNHEGHRADAELIAAAPDLLIHLELLCDAVERRNFRDPLLVVQDARKVIAQSKGDA
jgi:hypothetical protein